MEKIVILSLGKSGTTSTAVFFKKLGYKTIHYLGDTVNFNRIKIGLLSKKEIMSMGELLEKKYDVFCDFPYCFEYEYFDKKYKNTKFILITRDSKDWVKSVQNWNGYWNSLTLPFWEKYLNKINKNFKNVYKLDFSDEELKKLYDMHTKDVLEYFKDSKNFIHLNLYDKEINKKICNFLNISSNVPFPKENIS
jgi:hypothetical protein